MHFTVLSAIPLPQDIPTAVNEIPVDDVVVYATEKLLLKSLSSGKPLTAQEVEATMIDSERWECFVEKLVDDLLVPYDENNTDIAYMVFDDRTDEGKETYEQKGIDCVRTPDGRIIACCNYEFEKRYELHDGKVFRKCFGPLHHRKLTKKSKQYLALPDYPFRKLFPTFDAFMTDWWGCTIEEGTGRYGYYFNPNEQWDWWQIGGRWPFCFLVKNDCTSVVTGEPSRLSKEKPHWNAPEGYRWVAGARKCDIAWDVMREFIRQKNTERFHQYEEWFTTGCIPEKYAGRMVLVKDGIVSMGDYLYHKGEDLEHCINRLVPLGEDQYPIVTFAYVDADGWSDQGWETLNLGEDETQAWNKAVADFITKQPDNALLISVDCHT